jgi:hypothetical protein
MLAPLTQQAEQHLDQARRNFEVFGELRVTGRTDWACTALFYTALHLVSAHAALNGRRLGDNHGEVRTYIDQKLVSIKRPYKRLFDHSRDTRYDFARPTDDELQGLLDGDFGNVKSQLANRGVRLEL